MFIEFTTTITHRVEIGSDGLKGLSHRVEILSGEAAEMGEQAVFTIAKAGCESASLTLRERLVDTMLSTVAPGTEVSGNEEKA